LRELASRERCADLMPNSSSQSALGSPPESSETNRQRGHTTGCVAGLPALLR